MELPLCWVSSHSARGCMKAAKGLKVSSLSQVGTAQITVSTCYAKYALAQ